MQGESRLNFLGHLIYTTIKQNASFFLQVNLDEFSLCSPLWKRSLPENL